MLGSFDFVNAGRGAMFSSRIACATCVGVTAAPAGTLAPTAVTATAATARHTIATRDPRPFIVGHYRTRNGPTRRWSLRQAVPGGDHVVGRAGGGEVKALRQIAAEAAEVVGLARCFNSFGNDGQPQRLRQPDDSFDDRGVFG